LILILILIRREPAGLYSQLNESPAIRS